MTDKLTIIVVQEDGSRAAVQIEADALFAKVNEMIARAIQQYHDETIVPWSHGLVFEQAPDLGQQPLIVSGGIPDQKLDSI